MSPRSVVPCAPRSTRWAFRQPKPPVAKKRSSSCQSQSFDIVLLDMNMPGMGGMKTLVQPRSIAPRLPILMLTVVDGEEEKVEALECGADDYITKPFSIREVIARMRSAVRRSQAPDRNQDAPISIGDIEVQPMRRLVNKAGQPIHLTPKEYDILLLPDVACGPRRHLRQAAHVGLGPGLSPGGRLPAHLHPAATQEDRGRPLRSTLSAHRRLRRLPVR